MGEKRTTGKITARTAKIAGNGKDEKTGIRTNAARKRTTTARYKL